LLYAKQTMMLMPRYVAGAIGAACLSVAVVASGQELPAPHFEADALARAINAAVADVAALPSPSGEVARTDAVASLAAQREAPPLPQHTGLDTLLRDTLADFKAFPLRESTWVIVGVGGGLAAAVHPLDNSVNQHLVGHTWAENLWKPGHIVGGPVMAIVPVAMYLGGRYLWPPAKGESRTNKWSHLGLDLVRAEIVDEVIVEGLKYSVQRTRPNGSNYSFPSGHAAATFAFASVIERHLGYRLAWPTLVIATYVGTSRLHDNVHYLSDVVFGAAVGTAVGWTVVGRHGRSSYALAPMPVRGGIALSLTHVSADHR
jgi:membrane-associated phospholipid phosphatase